MRGYSDVTVLAAIVHNVSPKAAGLVVSAAAVDLETDARDFLAGHITRGLADGSAHGAKFVRTGPDHPAALTAQLIALPEHFVADSQKIARCRCPVPRESALPPRASSRRRPQAPTCHSPCA